MSSPSVSECPAAVRASASEYGAGAGPAPTDEDVACGCAARLLITASTAHGVERLARRIHAAGPRAGCPFVHLWARDFPLEPQALLEYCGSACDRAAGGSLLIDAVEEMPPTVQDALIELLAAVELTRAPSAAVRLVSGTTVSLHDRMANGTFSAQLFYRLNNIHLMAADGPPRLVGADDAQELHVIAPPLTLKL